MFYAFLTLYLLVVAIFWATLSVVIYHVVTYRLPIKDRARIIVLFFSTIGLILVIFTVLAFVYVPWDALGQ